MHAPNRSDPDTAWVGYRVSLFSIAACAFLFSLSVLVLAAPLAQAQDPPVSPRNVGTSFVVNSVGDEGDPDTDDGICDITGKSWVDDSYSGICTLWAAIMTANDTPALDTITFSGPMTIQPAEYGLAAIQNPIFLDGGGQVILDGSLLGDETVRAGLSLRQNSGGSTIRGLTIQKFLTWGILISDAVGGSTVQDNLIQENGVGVYTSKTSPNNIIHDNSIILNTSHGVQLSGSDNVVTANQIGTDGSQDLGNAGQGVYIALANDNRVGGTTGISPGGACTGDCNLISGNGGSGVRVSQGTDPALGRNNLVQGNFIGTDRSGMAAISNEYNGITTNADANIFRGNLIAGNGTDDHYNGYYGVYLSAGAVGNRVAGNLIGSAIDGATPLGNRGAGIYVYSANENIIGGGLPASASVGGPPASCAGECNVILGNGSGVYIGQAISPGLNQVVGNFIGVSADGTSAPGNLGNGLFMNGMTTTVTSNVIAGNLGNGVEVLGIGVGSTIPANFHLIQGNYIGVGPDGETIMGNGGHGVLITRSADNWIGGLDAGEGNIIAHNGGDGAHDGVVIIASGAYDAATGNRILGNSIHSNGGSQGMGIDLEGDGPSPNDVGDGDLGANYHQNAPVLSLISGTTVQGILESAANTAFHLEFFASPTCSETGFGQGKSFLGDLEVTTDGQGLAAFQGTLDTAPGTERLTATATDPDGNTSEFSACYNALVVNATGDGSDAALDGRCDTGQINIDGDPECTLRAALQEANATEELDTIAFAIPQGITPRIALQSGLPDVVQPAILDGRSQPVGRVVLDGRGAGGQVDGLRFLAEGSGVQGLTVSGFGGNGLVFLAGGNPRAAAMPPFPRAATTGLIVENNTGAGIVTQLDTILTDVIVRNNGGDGIGILIGTWTADATEGLTLRGAANQIVDNGGHGINTAPGHVRIEGGTQISGNGGWGIMAGGSVIILDGAMQGIHDNEGGGIFSGGTGADTFSLPPGFVVENNGGPGLVTPTDTILTDVIVRNNGGDGIGVLMGLWTANSTEGLTLSGTANQVVDNGGHGINTAPGHVRIEGGTQISGNGGWGIMAGGSVTIAEGAVERIHDNDGGGIQASEGLDLPPGLLVEENGGPGLVSINRDLYLESVTVRSNGGDGIGVVSGNLTLAGQGNVVTGNAESGINLREGNLILNDTQLSANGRYGIWAMNGVTMRLTDVTAQSNGLGGIRADQISLDGQWLFLDQNQGSGLVITGPNATVRNGRISRNGEYGVLAVDTVLDLNSVSVWGNGQAGVRVLSGGGLRVEMDGRAAAGRSTIAGSQIRNNGGVGVFYAAGPAGLSVRQSHLQEDGGYALINEDPAATVAAQGNWWGQSQDPGAIISGTVDYANWRTSPLAVVVAPDEEQFSFSAGAGITNPVGLRNYAAVTDTLTVVVTDTLGWLTSPEAFTVTLDADLGGSIVVTVTAPGDALAGAVTHVRVTAVSQQDESAWAWAEFRVMVLGREKIYLPLVVR